MATLRHLASPFLCALALAIPAAAQAIPGVSATLKAERGTVPSGATAVFTLTIEAKQDAELPAALVSGMELEATPAGGTAAPISEPGKGGAVAVTAGTRIERKLSVPVAKLAPTPPTSDLLNVEVSWKGLAGASCIVKVAPDASGVAMEDLDLEKTKVILVTSMGEMTLAFRPDKAPKHVENFVKLAKQGFYDNTKFHRVIRNFMVQGGDPNTKDGDPATWGQGDPGYKIDAEFNDLKHVRGTLSMARSSDPNSAGSQFFVCHKDASHLDGQYTAFGALESGADVLDTIATTPVGGPQGSTPNTPVVLFHALVLPVKKAK